ncbi:Uncharacterised protein [Streptococcus pneumoniae]|nr:Uncharacterised protein [Streptococcus pneumoniae]
MTTDALASPNFSSSRKSCRHAIASSSVIATVTPFPAASPSAFITIGAPFSCTYAFASSKDVNVSYSAVGMSYFFIKSLANCLLPSMIAAACDGPNTRRPAFSNSSTRPSIKGTSGPTMVRPTWFSFANETSPAWSLSSMFTSCAEASMPSFPGAANTFSTRLLCAAFHASVCSLPPLPIINTFTSFSSP